MNIRFHRFIASSVSFSSFISAVLGTIEAPLLSILKLMSPLPYLLTIFNLPSGNLAISTFNAPHPSLVYRRSFWRFFRARLPNLLPIRFVRSGNHLIQKLYLELLRFMAYKLPFQKSRLRIFFLGILLQLNSLHRRVEESEILSQTQLLLSLKRYNKTTTEKSSNWGGVFQ